MNNTELKELLGTINKILKRVESDNDKLKKENWLLKEQLQQAEETLKEIYG